MAVCQWVLDEAIGRWEPDLRNFPVNVNSVRLRIHVGGEEGVVVVVGADVVGQSGSGTFFIQSRQDFTLNLAPAGGIDGVSNIGEEPRLATGRGSLRIRIRQLSATAGAKVCSHFVLGMTAAALFRQFATGHGDKGAFGALDDLDIPDDEFAVQSD